MWENISRFDHGVSYIARRENNVLRNDRTTYKGAAREWNYKSNREGHARSTSKLQYIGKFREQNVTYAQVVRKAGQKG